MAILSYMSRHDRRTIFVKNKGSQCEKFCIQPVTSKIINHVRCGTTDKYHGIIRTTVIQNKLANIIYQLEFYLGSSSCLQNRIDFVETLTSCTKIFEKQMKKHQEYVEIFTQSKNLLSDSRGLIFWLAKEQFVIKNELSNKINPQMYNEAVNLTLNYFSKFLAKHF